MLILFIYIFVYGSQLSVSQNTLQRKGVPEELTRYCQEEKHYPQCLDLLGSSLPDLCFPTDDTCDPKIVHYRFDGSCNNIQFTMWGQSGTGYLRPLQAVYADGNYTIRKAKDGSDLPNARHIATTLFPMKQSLSNRYTVHFYAFGQWITHDVTQMTQQETGVPCCENGHPIANMSQECMPTLFPTDDPFFSKFNVSCIDLKRSIMTQNIGCDVTPVFQLNSETAFLDLSVLYGSDTDTASKIREKKNGKLKSMKINNREYPEIQNSCPLGGLTPGPGPCMLTGDIRINQNPELTVNEVTFMRMHNFIAEKLLIVNPKWDDERLFQESRRILIALYQHVVYSEHVPSLIGPELAERFELKPLTKGFVDGYQDKLNPQTIDAYESAAGRFLHSMILGQVSYANDLHHTDSYRLSDKYFSQNFLLEGNTFRQIIKGYAANRCDEQDEHFTPEIRNQLFKTVINPEWGTDLVAIDINRARDHGVPPYNEIRKACGLAPVQSFEELGQYLVDKNDVEKLKTLYKDVDDIDFYSIGILEKLIEGAASGITTACVVGESFFRWKRGDRIFYEFQIAGFTPEQLQTIRKASYSMFLCITNPDLKDIQKYSFLLSSKKNNPTMLCKDIPVPDFTLWKE